MVDHESNIPKRSETIEKPKNKACRIRLGHLYMFFNKRITKKKVDDRNM